MNGKTILITTITINMLKEEKINSMIFVEQTTFYVYRNENDRKEDIPCLITSNKDVFDNHKKLILNQNENEKLSE